MTRPNESAHERLAELLALRAVEGLAPAEAEELAALAARLRVDVEVDAYQLAAAAIELGSLPAELEEPPMRLLLLLQRDAERFCAEREPRAVERSKPAPAPKPRSASRPPAPARGERRPGRGVGVAWLVAAAALLVACFLLWQELAPALTFSPAELRAALLREAPDAVLFDWKGTADPAAVGAGGDVVWSNARQQGYMRIAGLAPNDPGAEQYQLWIFDARRPDATPVDGGVFDVPADAEELIVPIDAKLRVFEPGLFAVTVEEPGGVVVSERERIVLAGTLQ